jgi:hypothetical protein
MQVTRGEGKTWVCAIAGSVKIAPGVRLTASKTGLGMELQAARVLATAFTLPDAGRRASRVNLGSRPWFTRGHRLHLADRPSSASASSDQTRFLASDAVRYDRALAFELRRPKGAKAKADLERVYAADPGYEDVRERLADTEELGPGGDQPDAPEPCFAKTTAPACGAI